MERLPVHSPLDVLRARALALMRKALDSGMVAAFIVLRTAWVTLIGIAVGVFLAIPAELWWLLGFVDGWAIVATVWQIAWALYWVLFWVHWKHGDAAFAVPADSASDTLGNYIPGPAPPFNVGPPWLPGAGALPRPDRCQICGAEGLTQFRERCRGVCRDK